jgi:hypothetical protein
VLRCSSREIVEGARPSWPAIWRILNHERRRLHGLPDGQTADHTLVHISTCNGATAQKWAVSGSSLVN